MSVAEMNRVQRRLWKAFVRTGADTTHPEAIAQLRRLVQDQVTIMPPALRHVMDVVLFQRGPFDYAQLARDVAEREGVPVRPATLRKRVSRAVARIEEAIRTELPSPTRWIQPARLRLGLQPPPTGRPTKRSS
jgi:hypothetical protein